MIEKLGNLIELDEKKNSKKELDKVLGINISKTFIPTIANLSETDLSKYKVLNKNNFACNTMHVGRDEKLPISLYSLEKPSLISPAYKVFSVIDDKLVLPEYLMMFFQRAEFDRLAWYFCDSSIRGGLEWDRFCEIEVPLPTIIEQKKYVSIYNLLVKKLSIYENSINNLKKFSVNFFDEQIAKANKKKLVNLIQQTEERNVSLKNKNLLGISVKKVFIPSRANREDLDVSNCKIVKIDQFAYVTVTSRNGDKISIALNKGEEGIVSSTYIVFEVIDKNILLPDFLQLWFSRSEFDRYARYHSWGSARETFNWDDLCNSVIPLPKIETQESLVSLGKVLKSRQKTYDDIKNSIEKICTILFKGIIEKQKSV